MNSKTISRRGLGLVLVLLCGVGAAAAPESQRLIRARDFISEEQWAAAIDQLQAAIADPKEGRRDEALYWLAYSQHYSGDSAAAVATIGRLEGEFPKSFWVKQGQALRIRIAVRLERNDVLWHMAGVDPDGVFRFTPHMKEPPKGHPDPTKRPHGTEPMPQPLAPGAAPVTVTGGPLPQPMAVPASIWFPGRKLDMDLQIQALGSLMQTDPDKVIPILGRIAAQNDEAGNGPRAVFVLAQSSLPEARATVVRVAKTGPEPVQIAAVRQLARFYGRDVSDELLQVYATAKAPVKSEIVKSLGEAKAKVALVNIVQSEKERLLRSHAIVSLGRAGGVDQLTRMYESADPESKRSIIRGLFNARAEAELIAIAEAEAKAGSRELRAYALERVRLLRTPSAKEHLQKGREKR